MGGTLDDAAGEAFDKVARFLGLEYPGGPEIDRLSLLGDPEAIKFPRAMIKEPGFDVSYSGLKTSVINYVRKAEAAGEEISIENIAATFQAAVVEMQVAKTMAAAEHTGSQSVFLCGGVAANSGLRQGLGQACVERGLSLPRPAPGAVHRQRRDGGRLRHGHAPPGPLPEPGGLPGPQSAPGLTPPATSGYH